MADDIVTALTEAFEQAKKAGELDPDLDAFMEGTVVPTWQANSPEDSGAYADSVKVTKPAQAGEGEVAATVEYSHIVEWGSIDTPEFAPRAKTMEKLNPGGLA